MSILITGATGYLGKKLINEFDNKDDRIILTYRNKKPKIHNSFILKKFDFFEKSKDSYNYLEKPNTLIHLAWAGLNLRNYNSEIHINQINYHFDFIESLIKEGLKNLVVIGSCFEYGKYEGEIVETFESKPVTKYGEAKNMLRIKIKNLQKKYNFNFSWLRLFYFYGGVMNHRDLWGNLSYAIESKKKIFNLSKGDQLRDYLHIDDVVKYIKNVSLKKKNIGILNICSNEPVSIIDLVNSWKVKYEWEIQIKTNMVPIKDYENNNFWGSNKKLKFILNNN